jgi:hypothetical protein
MSHKAASPFPYPLTSDLAAFENEARAADLRDWSLAGRQCPYVLYGAGVAALVAYAGIVAATNAAVSVWAMMAVFIAAFT